MLIITKEPNALGAYSQVQSWTAATPPDGYAIIRDGLDLGDMFAHNGFITPTFEAVEYIRTVKKRVTVQEFEEIDGVSVPYNTTEIQTVDEPYTADTMTGYSVNAEAWEAWKASQPEPEEPEPTEEEDTSAMLIDHEFRLTMLELGLTDY